MDYLWKERHKQCDTTGFSDWGTANIISTASESVTGAAALSRKNVVWGAGDKVR